MKALASLLTLGLLVTGLSSPAVGEEKTETGYEIVQGKVICLGCTLKKEAGAKAQCSIYGHTNAIKTKDGKTWTILENDKSTALIRDHSYEGKDVEIRGKKYIDAQTIEVESVKVLSEE